MSYLEERGYVLRDAWQVTEFKCDIAFHLF